MAKDPEPMFQEGDVVRVVDIPYKDCPFLWTSGMDEFSGTETTITNVHWNNTRNAHVYKISADHGSYMWCENCFMVDSDIEESDLDIKLLFS